MLLKKQWEPNLMKVNKNIQIWYIAFVSINKESNIIQFPTLQWLQNKKVLLLLFMHATFLFPIIVWISGKEKKIPFCNYPLFYSKSSKFWRKRPGINIPCRTLALVLKMGFLKIDVTPIQIKSYVWDSIDYNWENMYMAL